MQRITMSVISLFLAVTFCGCARIDFGGKDGRLTYYDPKPYLLVSTNKECVTTGSVLVLPAEKKSLKFIPGYGFADLSVSLNNGMITNAGQKTDTQIPQTISAIADLARAAAPFKAMRAGEGCPPSATLYPIINGEPDLTKPMPLEVKTKSR
jgi:hypothetical protein